MSTWAGVALSVGIALVVGLVVHHYGLKQLAYEHSVAGGVTAGALTLLAAGDLFVEASREFWTQRPMLAATVTGGLMLGFTVLVVDGVINSRRAREMRKVLVGPVADLLWRSLLGELSTARDALASSPTSAGGGG